MSADYASLDYCSSLNHDRPLDAQPLTTGAIDPSSLSSGELQDPLNSYQASSAVPLQPGNALDPVANPAPPSPPVPAPGALFTGQGDFNGDGQIDWLWQDSGSGTVTIALKNSTAYAESSIPVSDLNWRIQGLADFNANGKTDLLWRNVATGETGFWLMNGATIATIKSIPVTLDWQIQGTSDFDRDGRADILWRNGETGQIGIWLMNGVEIASIALLPTAPGQNLQIAAIADLNQDNQSDLLLRNTLSGDNQVWLMNGTQVASMNHLQAEPDLNWQIQTTKDYNGDGKTDIIWRNGATNQERVWVMNNLLVQQVIPLQPAAAPVQPLSSSPAPTPPRLVSLSNLAFSGQEGDTGTFQLRLNQAPTSAVTLTLETSSFVVVDADGDLRNGTQNSLTFTPENWNQLRTVWFIAEKDASSADRPIGNTISYRLSGSLTESGTVDLGYVTNTYAPDPTRFNIDLDFRNDYLGFWTPARRAVAQQAANTWAGAIANEWTDFQLNNTINRLETSPGRPYSFVAKREVDDVLVFMNLYEGSNSGEGGLGGPDYEFGGWVTSRELMPRVGQVALSPTAYANQPDQVLYQAVLHELGHVLGLLGLNWTGYSLLDFATPQTAVFKGTYARAAYGSNIPLQSQDGANPVTGVYDYWHPANRVSSIMSYGSIYSLPGPSSIDYAMLADSGYAIRGINA